MATRSTADAAPDDITDMVRPTSHTRSTKSRVASDLYTPLSASDCFEESLSITVDTAGAFRVYFTPPRCDSESKTVFVFHHGAGYSGLSAACFAKEVRDHGEGEFGVMSFDCRGHGSSRVGTPSGDPPDLSLSTLTNDMVCLLKVMYPDRSTAPSLVLIGHSMGGAVVTEACPRIQKEVTHVIGLVILDVVEGSALASLPGMMSLVNLRPRTFASEADCIKYHIDSRTIRNLTSARKSVPSLIVRSSPNPPLSGDEGTISGQETAEHFTWITNLRDSQPFWKGWFTGLSQKFLAQKTARLLILAGADRLDKDLMIGQMQGKYQLTVIPDVGHCLHEDDPEKLAEVIITFCKRNETFTSEQILARLKKKKP